MKLRLVPARQGAQWLRQGWAVFFARPLAFCAMFLLCVLFAPVFVVLLGPVTWLGFMIATRQTLEGRFPWPSVFFEPFRVGWPQAKAQILLCMLFALGMVGVSWLAQLTGVDLRALTDVLMGAQSTPDQISAVLDDPKLHAAQWITLVGLALLSVPFWHASPLVHWGGLSAPKALFFSIVACWRNKAPLAVHALLWALVIAVLSMLAGLVTALAGAASLPFVTPLLLLLPAPAFASVYFSFADSFEAREQEPS
jgi:hypothetical protein